VRGIIYGLCEPETGELRYVGQTVTGLQRRVYYHRWNADRGDTHVQCWIRSLNGAPGAVLLENQVPEDRLNERERAWIRYAWACGARLTNSTDGGQGGRHTEETRRRIAEKMRGRTFTPEWRAKMSAAQRRRFRENPVTEERRREMSETSKRLGLRPPPCETRGAEHPGSRLTEDEAREILALRSGNRSQSSIAKEFGVSRRLVGFIWRGERWAHLQEPA